MAMPVTGTIPGNSRWSTNKCWPRSFAGWSLYWRHLKPDGVLAAHVSNGHLSLGPIVAMGALENHKRAMMIRYRGADDRRESASDWVLATSRPGFFDLPEITNAGRRIAEIPGLAMWTDDYSNLYRVLR